MQSIPHPYAFLKDVLSEISPTQSELKQAELASFNFISALNKKLKPKSANAVIGGSNRKQTQLRNTFEIDVFALFNYKKYSKDDSIIPGILEVALKKTFKKAERIHGSRDYFHVFRQPYLFEVIPILKISSSKQAKNITDVSPLHAKWVANNVKNKEGEIRLTKAFMSACGVYGAESYVRGFSGYACEILTIHYGSFLNLLKASKNWKEKQIIDVEKHYKSRNPMLEMNKSKTESAIIIIDPVQPGRNAAAALSEESFNRFRNAALKFIKKPSKDMFKKKTLSKNDIMALKGKNTEILFVEILPEKNKKDVMGAALLGKYELLRGSILKNGFHIKKSSWQWDGGKALLWFLIGKKYPSKYEERKGPQVSDKINSARFIKKHKNTNVSKGRLFAMVKRSFQTPHELVNSIISNQNFKSKLTSTETEWP